MMIDRYQAMTESGHASGKSLPLEELHALELPHMCVQVWVMTSNGNMLQVRRRPTAYWPGGWDLIAARAHVKADQNPLEAAMEQLRADLGWRVARIELTHFLVGGEPYPYYEEKLVGDRPKLHRVFCGNYSLLLPEMSSGELSTAFTLNQDAIGEVGFRRLEEFQYDAKTSAHLGEYAAHGLHPGLMVAAVEHLAQQKKEASN